MNPPVSNTNNCPNKPVTTVLLNLCESSCLSDPLVLNQTRTHLRKVRWIVIHSEIELMTLSNVVMDFAVPDERWQVGGMLVR